MRNYNDFPQNTRTYRFESEFYTQSILESSLLAKALKTFEYSGTDGISRKPLPLNSIEAGIFNKAF